MAEIKSLLADPCSCGLPHELIYGPEEVIFGNPATVGVNKLTEHGSSEMNCIKEIKSTTTDINKLIKDLSSNRSFLLKNFILKKGIRKERRKQLEYGSCKKKLKNVIGSKKGNYIESIATSSTTITKRRSSKSVLNLGSGESTKFGKHTKNQSCGRKLKDKHRKRTSHHDKKN